MNEDEDERAGDEKGKGCEGREGMTSMRRNESHDSQLYPRACPSAPSQQRERKRGSDAALDRRSDAEGEAGKEEVRQSESRGFWGKRERSEASDQQNQPLLME